MKRNDPQRLWGRYQVNGECWEWSGYRNPNGYGLIMWNGQPRRRVHRVAWELTYGLVPFGMHVLHRCDNPPCIRPEHLFLGTQTDNQRDMRTKRRDSPLPRRSQAGESNNAAKLTGQSVGAIRLLAVYGVSQAVIADAFGISDAAVSLIVGGKRWAHVRPSVM